MAHNLLIIHGGAPTAVINSSLYGAITEAGRHTAIGRILGARLGSAGVLKENFIDLTAVPDSELELLLQTPASAIGTSRDHLEPEDYARMAAIFEKHNIRYVLINGGNGSMDTCGKISRACEGKGISVVGIPKTIDNDIAVTDHAPGYGSAARFIAATVAEIAADVKAMPIHVCVIEAMGRNAGWIAAGTALAKRDELDAPHIILLPEVPFDPEAFKARLRHFLSKIGYAVVVVSEGTRRADGTYISEQKGEFAKDSFGHTQLGGAANFIKNLIEREVKVKSRFAIPSTMQRNGIHLASLTDSREAYGVGKRAVECAADGVSGKMVALRRLSDSPYRCDYDLVDLSLVANGEKAFPREWISPDGFFVTEAFLQYARPLIQGEVAPVIEDGIPRFSRFKRYFVTV